MMHTRCFNPRNPGYAWTGARGITVCDRWRYGENGDDGFECFIEDMGRKPAPHLRLTRIDKSGDYTPDNCAWLPQRRIKRATAHQVAA